MNNEKDEENYKKGRTIRGVYLHVIPGETTKKVCLLQSSHLTLMSFDAEICMRLKHVQVSHCPQRWAQCRTLVPMTFPERDCEFFKTGFSKKRREKRTRFFRNGLSCKARGLRMMMSEKSGWNDYYIESTDLDWWISSHAPFPPSSLIFTPSGLGVVDEDSPRLLQQHPRSCFNSLIAIQDAHISPTTRNGV